MTTETPVVGLTTRPATGTKQLSPLTRERKRRELARRAGHEPFYPIAPVMEHIKTLNDSGMANDLIARNAGVAQSTMSQFTRGLSKSIRRATALRILAVQPATFDDIATVPAIGSMRRLQALYAISHSPLTIANVSGLSDSSVMHIANGRYRKVNAATADAIAAAYVELSQTEGDSPVARSRAQAMNWRDPLWWEDMGHIDDPAFDPATAERPLNFHEQAELRAAEILHLASYGAGPEEIAERLGLGKDYVVARLRELRKVAA